MPVLYAARSVVCGNPKIIAAELFCLCKDIFISQVDLLLELMRHLHPVRLTDCALFPLNHFINCHKHVMKLTIWFFSQVLVLRGDNREMYLANTQTSYTVWLAAGVWWMSSLAILALNSLLTRQKKRSYVDQCTIYGITTLVDENQIKQLIRIA